MQFRLLTLITQLRKITGWSKKMHRVSAMSLGLHAHQIYLPAISFFGVTSNQKVYVRKPRTVDDLKVPIREKIATVPQEMSVNVMQNFEVRLRTCVRQEGRHLSDIIFRNWVINVSNQNCIYYTLFWCLHIFFYIENKPSYNYLKKKRAFFLRHPVYVGRLY